MGRVLVLGASGFLATHLVDALEMDARGEHVTCVTRKTTSFRWRDTSRISWTDFNAVDASTRDLTALLHRVKPDSVVNCIGMTRGSDEELHYVNVQFVRNLVAAIERYGSSSLVHLGSAAEYGKQPVGVPIGVLAAPCPVAEYGRSKRAGSEVVSSAVDSGAIQARVLRIFNPLGAGSPLNSVAGAVARTMQCALRDGRTAIVVGELSDYRDFVDARDVASAIALCAVGSNRGSTLLNVGRGQAVQARELVSRLAAVAGYRGELHEEPPVMSPTSLVTWQEADISLTQRELGWTPTYSLDDALLSLWESLTTADVPAV